MAKIKIFDRELYYDTTDDDIYELRPDGTYQKTHTGGAARTRLTASEVAFPEQWSPPSDSNIVLAAGASGRVCWTAGDLSIFNALTIEVVAVPTGTAPILQLYPTLDGTNFAATPLAFINLATGAIIAGTTGLNAIGIYAVLPVGGGMKVKGAQMKLNGGAADLAIAAGAVRFLMGNV